MRRIILSAAAVALGLGVMLPPVGAEDQPPPPAPPAEQPAGPGFHGFGSFDTHAQGQVDAIEALADEH